MDPKVHPPFLFFDGAYLDIDEISRIERGMALNYNYRYHYQRPE